MMRFAQILVCSGWSLVVATLALPPLAAAEPVSTDADFFEQKVRPILAERCWDCHGEDTQESGLRLDSRADLLGGGNSGKTTYSSERPETSYLLQVMEGQGPVQMPPDDPLPSDELAILTRWVKLGVPWAESSESNITPLTKEDRFLQQTAAHWSFQPIDRPALPAVKRTEWIRTGIDHFIMANLEARHLGPSPVADRYTLIRRLKFDLLGLPPTYEEAQAYIHDASPQAYEHLVDRYLASPRYGERWGRHWLDVARYADTRGYAFGRERRFPYAYTYRDYVIDAMNRDLPIDQFVMEQLAADLLGTAAGDGSLAALGFLTVGRRFNRRNLDIDDQIDVVGRGLLGLTVACARCHDHKYDPIPTDDYYSLYGIFDSCAEPRDLPVIGDPTTVPGYAEFKKELEKRQAALDHYKRDVRDKIVDIGRRRATDYLVRAITRSPEKLLQEMPFISLRGEELKPRLVQRWREYLVRTAKADHPVLGPMYQLALLPDEKYAEKAPAILEAWAGVPTGTQQGRLNPLVRQAMTTSPPTNKIELARLYGDLFSRIFSESSKASKEDLGKEGTRNAPADLAVRRQIFEIIAGPDSPTSIDANEINAYLSRAENNKYREFQRKIDAHQVDAAGAPPRAMVLHDSDAPHDAKILIRGSLARPGKTVPRQFLLALAGPKRMPFDQGSGRLELARAIVSAGNPLTARVFVNRIWMHHFGTPLVSTPSDFGSRCDKPLQLDLLNYLASQFLSDEWSLKKLHRRIVLSNTYRQSSLNRPDAQEADPENARYWRMNRRRLEFEPMWDSLLQIAGQLDTTIGGRPVKLNATPFPKRRAIYGFIDRQDLPGLYRVFDLGSPDSSCPRRARTTVPQQALFLMNSPFVIQQAQAVAARKEMQAERDAAKKLDVLYRLVVARQPTATERGFGLQFINDAATSSSPAKLDRWVQYAQVLMMSNAYLFVD